MAMGPWILLGLLAFVMLGLVPLLSFRHLAALPPENPHSLAYEVNLKAFIQKAGDYIRTMSLLLGIFAVILLMATRDAGHCP
jgi:hypothetical protein